MNVLTTIHMCERSGCPNEAQDRGRFCGHSCANTRAADCGTDRGYHKHWREGEPACTDCKAAHAGAEAALAAKSRPERVAPADPALRDTEALQLRQGLTYQQIAERLGFKSRTSALNAVTRALAVEPGRQPGADRRLHVSVVVDDDAEASISVLGDPVYKKALRGPFYERNPDLRVCLEPIPEDLPDVCHCEYEEYDDGPYDCDHGPPMSIRLSHQLRARLDSEGRRILARFEDLQVELMTCHREDATAHVLSEIRYEPGVKDIDTERSSKPPELRLVDNGAPAPMRQALGDAELIDRYVQHIRRRNLAPTTVQQFTESLRLFAKEHEGGFATATRASVDAVLDARAGLLGATSLSSGRRYWLLSCLHGFYAWAVNEELLESDPTAKIQRPKLTKRLPRPMPDYDLARALAGAGAVTKCWLLLGAYQGLRCQEIAGLSREDVMEGDMKLRVVHGKGRKQRMLPLHPEVLAALESLPMPVQGALFLRPRKLDPYPPPALVVALNKYLRELGISSTAHTLRHWFGTAFYNETQDLRLTQEMMGHEDPATTALYTQPDWQRTAPAVAALSVKVAGSTTPSSANAPAQPNKREARVERQRLTGLSVPPVFATVAERDAEALRLRELEFSYRQIARQLGWAAPNTAFEAVRRARVNRQSGETSDPIEGA